HRDPFSVLGPHADGDAAITVRAFLPDAREVAVVSRETNDPPQPLRRAHPAGLWGATLSWPLTPADRLRLIDPQGHVSEIEDPYRFPPTLSDYDLHLLAEGTHYRIYDKLGAHRICLDGVDGVIFAVWAPNAGRVSVVGDWNAWDGRRHPMRLHPGNGIWELFVPATGDGVRYKFETLASRAKPLALKADPFAFSFEPDSPRAASVVVDLDGHEWHDAEWMTTRADHPQEASLAIYEVHLGSWRRAADNGDRFL